MNQPHQRRTRTGNGDEVNTTTGLHPVLGTLHLLIPNMPVKGANLRRNAEEGRIAIVRCVADA